MEETLIALSVSVQSQFCGAHFGGSLWCDAACTEASMILLIHTRLRHTVGGSATPFLASRDLLQVQTAQTGFESRAYSHLLSSCSKISTQENDWSASSLCPLLPSGLCSPALFSIPAPLFP